MWLFSSCPKNSVLSDFILLLDIPQTQNNDDNDNDEIKHL